MHGLILSVRVPPSTLNRYDRGFTFIEAISAVALSGVLIALCLFLSSESSRLVGKRIAGSRGYLALQNLSEQLLVSNGANGYLDEGEHGPMYLDTNGKVVSTPGPIELSWHVKSNDPSPGIMRISTSAKWSQGSSATQSVSLVLFRNLTQHGSATTVETVPLMSPSPRPSASPAATPLPTPPPTSYAWKSGSWGGCSGVTETRTRSVSCRDNNGRSAAAALCGSEPKPPTSEHCDPRFDN